MAFQQNIKAGCDIWLPSPETVWEQATVLAVTGSMATVRTTKDDVVQLDLATVPSFLCNPALAADVTSLHYIHEPGILYNLEQRSGTNEPYTFLGSVLVAVNPLKVIEDPPGILGQKKAASVPHPYGIAEVAYSQMAFAEARKGSKKAQDEEIISNQSIVISGESGSGKTESSKYVLKHLVSKNEAAGGAKDLDERLLGSNPILEAFGNASTLRNHNSSRFGKFMRLHFLAKPRVGDSTLFTIAGASVVTYLLERSRITSHNNGERGYHVFYQLKDGTPASLKKELGLDANGGVFKFTTPRGDSKVPASATKLKVDDKVDFATMDSAWGRLGISSEIKDSVFKALAGVLHLGNVEFTDEERPEGNCAIVKPGGYGALEHAGRLLGVDPVLLGLMFREHEVQAGTETVTKRRDSAAASYARDATAKALYAQLFEWVVETINNQLDLKNDSPIPTDQLPFIGVLDIFGFESFEKNDFEQLLINYTNESLQNVFNRQVFVAEMDLYRKEGLILGDGGMELPPDNSVCMALMAGKDKAMGLLKLIDAESQTPQANDPKMNKVLHKAFITNECFIKPHPKDIAATFIIRHYAGAVVYTVGRFIEKNVDRLPKEVGALFEKSTTSVVSELFAVKGDKAAAAKRAFGGSTIIGKFTGQIQKLIETLESTRDSFIRCVKPSPSMIRTNDLSWFDRRYVTQQLKCLSIPQTAEVLKAGLPTRIPYELLTENYRKVLPEDAISIWNRLGGGEQKGFTSALFWAFEVPSDSYRLGMTRVFFKSGELSNLDKIMESAARWESGTANAERDAVVKRFKFFYVRTLWRKAVTKTFAYGRFSTFLLAARGKQEASAKVQALLRMKEKRQHFNRTKRGAVMAQKLWRAKQGRKLAAARRAEKIEEARKAAEEAKRLEEEARKKAEEERLAAEAARQEAERRAAKAAESERAAIQAQIEKMKIEEAERAKRAEGDALRLRLEREKLQDEEKRCREENEVAIAREEKEAKEFQERLERDEAAKSAEEGRKKDAGGQQRTKSVVREMRKSVSGVSQAEKNAKIAEVKKREDAEKTAWSNASKAGWLSKMEKGGFFTGKKAKKEFFMLRVVDKRIELYLKANAANKVGEPVGKPKEAFEFERGKLLSANLDDPKLGKFAFTLSTSRGNLELGCDTEEERREWFASAQVANQTFKISAETEAAMKRARDLVVTPTVQTGDITDEDISKLPAETQEQLAKIESLYETGLLTRQELDQLRPIIIQQGREALAAQSPAEEAYDAFPSPSGRATIHGQNKFRPTMVKQLSAFDELGYMSNDSESAQSAMVVCNICSILNMHGGSHCVVCSAPLPKPDDPTQQLKVKTHRASMQVTNPTALFQGMENFGPADGKWLAQMTFRGGGLFRCYVKDVASVMDQSTWTQTALYIIGCNFTQGMFMNESWTARHSWSWFEKWHQKAVKVNMLPTMPAFPQVDGADATSTNTGTMNKLKAKLSAYLGEILASVKDTETFLKSDMADKMFKIKDNVQDEVDFNQYSGAYQDVLSANLAGSDASMPLTRDEMQIADDAGTLLMTFIRGDGTTKALDILDERVSDLHSVCVAALPRLRASQDPENPAVDHALIPAVLDTLEHLEKSIQVYNDTLAAHTNKYVDY